MNLQELYDLARPIPERLVLENKYCFAIDIELIEGRYLDINDALKKQIVINDYVKNHEQVLVIPNRVEGKIVDITVMPLDGSKEILYLGGNVIPFGAGNLDFKYNDKLFVVEGISDYAALKYIKPDLNVVAIRTNSVSNTMLELIKSMTSNVVFITDSDEAGNIGYYSSRKKFKAEGITLSRISQYEDMKDTGEILDMCLKLYNALEKDEYDDTLSELKFIKIYFNEKTKD